MHLIKHELEFVNKLIADLKKALNKKEAYDEDKHTPKK